MPWIWSYCWLLPCRSKLSRLPSTNKWVSSRWLILFLNNFCFVDRPEEQIKTIEEYLKATKQLRDYSSGKNEPAFSTTVSLDLSTVVSSVSGPKRPNDRVSVSDMKTDFANCLTNKVRLLILVKKTCFVNEKCMLVLP